ncbi:MAG: hypothetical protein M1834_009298 [Cirrosporium novae-zelandiae]|nr:MAG: hypothetical protein M1834_009298 [Cirrosporium novae-zelandiae]
MSVVEIKPEKVLLLAFQRMFTELFRHFVLISRDFIFQTQATANSQVRPFRIRIEDQHLIMDSIQEPSSKKSRPARRPNSERRKMQNRLAQKHYRWSSMMLTACVAVPSDRVVESIRSPEMLASNTSVESSSASQPQSILEKGDEPSTSKLINEQTTKEHDTASSRYTNGQEGQAAASAPSDPEGWVTPGSLLSYSDSNVAGASHTPLLSTSSILDWNEENLDPNMWLVDIETLDATIFNITSQLDVTPLTSTTPETSTTITFTSDQSWRPDTGLDINIPSSNYDDNNSPIGDSLKLIDPQNPPHQANHAVTSHYGPRRLPDPYINHLRINTIALISAYESNAFHIGLTKTELCTDDSESPFYRSNLKDTPPTEKIITAVRKTFQSIKPDLRPLPVQITISHHPYLDILPFPELRHRAISLASTNPAAFDEDQFFWDVLAGGLICWGGCSPSRKESPPAGEGVPWDIHSWEAEPWFLKKWRAVTGGADGELGRQTRWWREMRGEEEIELE